MASRVAAPTRARARTYADACVSHSREKTARYRRRSSSRRPLAGNGDPEEEAAAANRGQAEGGRAWYRARSLAPGDVITRSVNRRERAACVLRFQKHLAPRLYARTHRAPHTHARGPTRREARSTTGHAAAPLRFVPRRDDTFSRSEPLLARSFFPASPFPLSFRVDRSRARARIHLTAYDETLTWMTDSKRARARAESSRL